MADYDKYYKTEDLFGEAYPELIDFFRRYKPKGKLLDLGCGQGRDSIPLALLGFQVTGIDSSKIGIQQIKNKSKKLRLKITGLVEDLYQFNDFENYDIVLLDSMFHFEKRDIKQETELIKNIALKIKRGGTICFCILDTGSKVKILKQTITDTKIDFKILNDSSLMYSFEDKESGHKSESKYCMFIVQKI